MSKKLVMLFVGILSVIGLAACTNVGAEDTGYYVSIDINPSIEFMVDAEDNVVSYLFLNEDAEILCSDLDFTGMNVDDAVELFIQTATEAGYIDPEGNDNAVLITVLCEENEQTRAEEIKERIRKTAIRHLARRYINGVVLTEDFTQEDLVAEAEALEVSPGKLKLAYAAMAVDETLVLEELLEMPVKDIFAVVKELHEDEWTEYKQERREELQERKQEMIEEHKAEIQAYLDANPEMTEEEIEAYIESYKQEVKEEAKEQWQERVQQWRERQEERKNNRNSNE